jgi:hypothetical protein
LLIVVHLKAESGAPWRPQDAGNCHDQSRYKFACCRNIHLLFLFLLFRCHRRHASFPHNVPFWMTRYNDWFGVEAAKPTAPMPARMLFVTLLGRHRRSPGTLPYIYLRRTQLTTTPQCLSHVVTKWPTAAAMVPHSQRQCTQWSPSMLADCCMQLRRGPLQPPRLDDPPPCCPQPPPWPTFTRVDLSHRRRRCRRRRRPARSSRTFQSSMRSLPPRRPPLVWLNAESEVTSHVGISTSISMQKRHTRLIRVLKQGISFNLLPYICPM